MATSIQHSIAKSDEVPFDGDHEINPNATIADLLHAMFENGCENFPGSFVDRVRACVTDELTLISEVAEGGSYGKTLARVALRAEWWLLIAPKIQRRMDEATSEIEQHEIDDWELYRVPTAGDVPQFEHARLAIHKDFSALGYCHRTNVVDAIGVMLRGKDETSRGAVVEDIEEVLES